MNRDIEPYEVGFIYGLSVRHPDGDVGVMAGDIVVKVDCGLGEQDIPPRTPWTRFFGPPLVLMSRPPNRPPIAPTDWVVPSASTFSLVRARIMGAVTAKLNIATKFMNKKTICSPNKLGRAKI